MSTATMSLGDPITFSSGIAGTTRYYNSDATYYQTDGTTWANDTNVYGGSGSWIPWPSTSGGTAGSWTIPVYPQVIPAIDEEAIEREVARRLMERGVPARPSAPPPPPPPKVAPSVEVDEVPKILPKRIIED